ncbi:MAG: gluconokinase [Trueperaceae bacterium]
MDTNRNSPGIDRVARAVVVMGVSGSGKSTVGGLLARRLGWEFADADTYHPQANILKMAAGIPLDDEDRMPWLVALRSLIDEHLAAGRSLVLACSALKRQYRRILAEGSERVSFVYLKGSRELILRRMSERSGHYMKPELLDSQFEALEEPADALVFDIDLPPVKLAELVALALQTGSEAR